MIEIESGFVFPSTLDNNAPALCPDDVMSGASFTSTTADADYPLTNLRNPATNQGWRGTANGAETVSAVFSSTPVNFVAIAKHNLGSTGRTLSITGDKGAGTVTVGASISPTDDKPIMFFFTQGDFTEIDLVMGAGSAPARIAVAAAGRAIGIPSNIYVGHSPIDLNKRRKSATGKSESGEFLGRKIIQIFNKTSIPFNNIPPQFYRDEMDPFFDKTGTNAFFFGWRPGTYPVASYVWMEDDPTPINELTNGFMSVDLNVKGIA